MTAVEAWTAKQLTQLGVDGVFAPYVLGMLGMEGGRPTARYEEDEEDEKRQEVLDLLMGWLDDSHQVQTSSSDFLPSSILIMSSLGPSGEFCGRIALVRQEPPATHALARLVSI
jgi:hypothetical protein